MRLATIGFVGIVITTLFMIYESDVWAKDTIIVTDDDRIIVCKPPVNGVVVCY